MKKLSGWQKAGLFAGIGCLSIVVIIVVGAMVAVMWARSTMAQYGDTNPTRTERTIALPAPRVAAPAAGAAAKGAAPIAGEPLRLTVNLQDGDFTVQPGPPGGQVHVDGTYAQGMYELTEEGSDEAGGARTIRFRAKAPAWARLLSGFNNSENRPHLTVAIPAGVPIDLSLSVGQGESRIDLGGLTLKELRLDVAMGNHRVDFKEPVVPGLRSMRLSASMGNISIDHLGNARAQTIDASGSMGNLTADLGGNWQREAEADISFRHSMGELTVNVPTQVKLDADVTSSQGKADNRSADSRETQDPAAPKLRLRVSTSMGDGHVTRY